MSKENLHPGENAPASGIYKIIGPRGGDTGKERVAEEGEPLPPTPEEHQTYKLVRKARH